MTNETITTAEDDSAVASKPTARQLQLVRAGASQFGVFADEIATIVAWRKPTPLPQAPKPVLGVVSVQGRILTVLDLASLTGEVVQSDSRGEAVGDAPGKASHSPAQNDSRKSDSSSLDLLSTSRFASSTVLLAS